MGRLEGQTEGWIKVLCFLLADTELQRIEQIDV